jgi:hypothetical protein
VPHPFHGPAIAYCKIYNAQEKKELKGFRSQTKTDVEKEKQKITNNNIGIAQRCRQCLAQNGGHR